MNAVKASSSVASIDEEASLAPIVIVTNTARWRSIAVNFLSRIWNAIVSPPNLGLSLGIAAGLIPFVKSLFVGSTTTNAPPLSPLYDAAAFVGGAAVPVGLLNIGGALSRIKIKKRDMGLSYATLAGITVSRLLIMPVVGMTVMWLLYIKTGWLSLETDRILAFMLMLQACVPPGQSTVFFTQLYSPDGEAKQISVVVLFTYILCLLTLPVCLFIILHLIS